MKRHQHRWKPWEGERAWYRCECGAVAKKREDGPKKGTLAVNSDYRPRPDWPALAPWPPARTGLSNCLRVLRRAWFGHPVRG